jgi:4a-hydroxytetrahydrobiopterin dehydratase
MLGVAARYTGAEEEMSMADRNVLDEAAFVACGRALTWRFEEGRLAAMFRFDSYTLAGRFVGRLAAMADQVDHHPEVWLGYPAVVRVASTTHDVGGVTELDLALAELADALAAELSR